MEFFARMVNAYARSLNDLAAILVGRKGVLVRNVRPAHMSPLQAHNQSLTRNVAEFRAKAAELPAKAEVGSAELKMLNRDLQVVLGDFSRAFYKLKAEVQNGR